MNIIYVDILNIIVVGCLLIAFSKSQKVKTAGWLMVMPALIGFVFLTKARDDNYISDVTLITLEEVNQIAEDEIGSGDQITGMDYLTLMAYNEIVSLLHEKLERPFFTGWSDVTAKRVAELDLIPSRNLVVGEGEPHRLLDYYEFFD
jgi:hypothetical protein